MKFVKGFSRSGRAILRRSAPFIEWERAETVSRGGRLEALCHALMGMRGQASGVAIATEVFDSYDALSEAERLAFFRYLAEAYAPEPGQVRDACRNYADDPSAAHLARLTHIVESPRRELYRRMNLTAKGVSRLVNMRSDLLRCLESNPELRPVDEDLCGLLQAWFNRGFLEMRQLSWSSPADILERIIRYEAVHSIKDWADLRRRLDPPDRRCFAFFHPAMPDEPLIFVEVALTVEIPSAIGGILGQRAMPIDPAAARCAVFYSISNCQQGLTGISFGNFLIKQVASDLARELPQLQWFVTLSPVPGFVDFLRGLAPEGGETLPDGLSPADIARFSREDWWSDAGEAERLQRLILPHAARYFQKAKNRNGKPLDPVARFHLGNGARLERLNWLGDRSPEGLRQSGGLMVNYLYHLPDVEENHEAYAIHGTVVVGKPVRQLARDIDRDMGESDASRPKFPGIRLSIASGARL